VYVGQAHGYFTQEVVDLQPIQVPAAFTLSQAVLSGDINVVTFTVLSMAAAVAAGAPLKFIASAQDMPVLQIVGGPGVQSWADLRGKVVGSGNSAGDYFDIATRMMLAANGLQEGDYTIRTMPGAARVPSLLSGQTAGSILNERDAHVAVDAGGKRLGYMHEYVKDVTYSGFMVDDAWGKANEAVVVRYLRALLRGTNWLFDPANRAEAIRIFHAEAPELELPQVELMYEQMIVQQMLSRTLRPNMQGVENILNIAHQQGALTEIPPYDTWIDLSYLEKASR
jgi:ABC-type nitrate/sulfonate/bicarbonate transport system substrate-binding protein